MQLSKTYDEARQNLLDELATRKAENLKTYIDDRDNPKWTEVTLTGLENLETIASQFGVDTIDIEQANSWFRIRQPDGHLRTDPTMRSGRKILVPSDHLTVVPGLGNVQPAQCKQVPAGRS